MRAHYFDVSSEEVLRNLTIGLKEQSAERDLRSTDSARRLRGSTVLHSLEKPARDLTPMPCKDVDPEVFFPYHGPEHGRDKETADALLEQARETCAGCSIARQCLDEALDRGETFGVWGGRDFATDPEIRNRITDSRQRSAS